MATHRKLQLHTGAYRSGYSQGPRHVTTGPQPQGSDTHALTLRKLRRSSSSKWRQPAVASPAFSLPVCATLLLPAGPRTPPGSGLASSTRSVGTQFYWTPFLRGSWTRDTRVTGESVRSPSPSWSRCRGRTLGERAGSPDSCSRSGPPAPGSRWPRSRPCPPGGAAAPPRTRPSWRKRCRTPAAPSGTLEVVQGQKEAGRFIPEHVPCGPEGSVAEPGVRYLTAPSGSSGRCGRCFPAFG